MNVVTAILSLGSNIEPRRTFIEKAVQEIAALPGTHHVRCSSIHETEPVGVPEAESRLLFLNAVVALKTSLSPHAFSTAIHAIEERLGRIRTGAHGAARTLDIDIIAFGDAIMNTSNLTLPHPHAHHRAFVLQPLAELFPDYILPGHRQTVTQLLKGLSSSTRKKE
jgi:2-amino-4-hydroxy-6-hydroxymethyldihydropteridine diphosphokinase